MDVKKIVVPGRFASLNDYIDACRRSRGKYDANRMKQRDQAIIRMNIPKGMRFNRIYLRFFYFELNTKRDKDNVSSYFHKIFLDALVQAGCIRNDGWNTVQGFSDNFDVDKKNPRIEVLIEEV